MLSLATYTWMLPGRSCTLQKDALPMTRLDIHVRRYGRSCLPVLRNLVLDIGAVMGHIIFGDLKRILACLLQVRQLLTLYLQQLVNVLFLYLCVLCICHFFHSLLYLT